MHNLTLFISLILITVAYYIKNTIKKYLKNVSSILFSNLKEEIPYLGYNKAQFIHIVEAAS